MLSSGTLGNYAGPSRPIGSMSLRNCSCRGPTPDSAITAMLILTNEEIESLLRMDDCIAILEEAYLDLARGMALNSFRGENLAPCGRDDAHYTFKHMGGTWPARQIHALRINSDIIS